MTRDGHDRLEDILHAIELSRIRDIVSLDIPTLRAAIAKRLDP